VRIWITGAGGMVGTAIIRSLDEQGGGAEILAPRSSELDLTHADQVQAFLESHQPEVVVHAAGRVGGIAANVADPVGFLIDNMAIGMNVIQGAHKAGVQTLINIASSCMYPRDHSEPLVESDVLTGPLKTTNEGYALAKIASDRLCAYIAQTAGRDYRTVVPSNLYGPGDHFDDRRGHLIANAIRKIEEALRTGADEVTIWGDGTARREFTYVDDVAHWIARLATDGVTALPSRLNAGTGVDFTVREFYERIGEVCGYTGGFQFDLSKPSGMKRKLMDSSLAAEYGWTAPTTLRQGLASTVNYYRREIPAA
jgi:GDP-L-fucose synthase